MMPTIIITSTNIQSKLHKTTTIGAEVAGQYRSSDFLLKTTSSGKHQSNSTAITQTNKINAKEFAQKSIFYN